MQPEAKARRNETGLGEAGQSKKDDKQTGCGQK